MTDEDMIAHLQAKGYRVRVPAAPSCRIAELTGVRFGRLIVKSFAGTKHGDALWECQCDCGNKTIAKAHNLKRGDTSSCGCLRVEKCAAQGRRSTGRPRKAA